MADIRWREKDGKKVYTAYSPAGDKFLRETEGDGIVSIELSDDKQMKELTLTAQGKGLTLEEE